MLSKQFNTPELLNVALEQFRENKRAAMVRYRRVWNAVFIFTVIMGFGGAAILFCGFVRSLLKLW